MALIEKFKTGSFLHGAFLLAGGSGLGGLATWAVAPLLSRLFTPGDFAIYGAMSSLTMLLGLFISLRMELALPLPMHDDEARHVFGLGICAAVIFSVLLAVILIPFHSIITSALRIPNLVSAILWLPVGGLLIGLNQMQVYWAIRKSRIPALSAAKITQGCIQAGTQAGAGYAALGALGLYGGDVLARGAAVFVLALNSWRNDSFQFSKFSRVGMAAAWTRYRRFSGLAMLSAVFNVLGQEWPVLWLTWNFSSVETGAFVFTHRLLWLSITMLGQAMGQVYTTKASALLRENPKGLEKLFLKTAILHAGSGALPCLILAGWGSEIFVGVFGTPWREAGHIAQELAGTYWAMWLVAGFWPTLNLFEKLRTQLAWDILRWAGVALGMWWVTEPGVPALEAVRIFGAVQAVVYLLFTGLTWQAIRQRKKHSSETK